VEDLADGFAAQHTNITFKKDYEDCGNFETDIVNRMTSDSAPDIIQYVDSAVQKLATAGHVRPLDDYAAAYGWDEKFPADELNQLKLTGDGKVHGEGNQLGIPGGASFTGVFYNKALLAEAGYDAPPATFEEFEASLAAAKDKDLTPIALGSLDDGGIHMWGGMLTNLMGLAEAQAWVNGKPESSIDTPGAVEAATKLRAWAEAGYFPASANGTKEDDARAAFAAGEAVYTIDGSWAVGTVGEGLGENAGFFTLPGASADGPATGQGFVAGFAISASSDKADAAAAFLDWLSGPESAAISVGLGMLPVNTDTAPAPDPGVATDLRNGYAKAAADGGIVTFFDHATPDMHTELTQGIQAVIAGELAPEDFVAGLQTNWVAAKG
jgi:raffinose/stachyose/melibiose transport system substrate-binding protein